MIGVVLAAGTGRRLQPYTDELPKALVPVPTGDADGSTTTPLDVILGNFAASGLTDVAIVVGYAAEAVRKRKEHLQERYSLRLELIDNPKATSWNNCYSLWCARDLFAQGVLLSNGDTVHPRTVERLLLPDADHRPRGADPGSSPADPSAAEPGAALLLALDTVKRLGEEEMKVSWDAERGVRRITKLMDPAEAYGEYIGVCRIAPDVAEPLADALEATWRKDPSLYYEDGFQELVDRGGRIDVAPIGDVPWIEIDDLADLARAADVLRALNTKE